LACGNDCPVLVFRNEDVISLNIIIWKTDSARGDHIMDPRRKRPLKRLRQLIYGWAENDLKNANAGSNIIG